MYEMHGEYGMVFGPALLWWIVVSIPFAIGAYLVAGRIGRPQWLWAILAVVPVVNFLFYIYAFYAVLLYILDRLNQAAPRANE